MSKQKYVSEIYLEEAFSKQAFLSSVVSSIIGIMVSKVIGATHKKLMLSGKRKNRDLTIKLRKIVGNGGIEVYILDKNKQLNAFADDAAIYLTPAMLKKLSTREQLAVCLHEYGHFIEKHEKQLKRSYIIGDICSGILISVVAGFFPIAETLMAHFGLASSVATAKVVNAKVSRPNEFAADSYAKQYGYKKDLISALQKLEEEFDKEFKKISCKKLFGGRLDEDKCEKKLEKYKKADIGGTHPTFRERIDVLNKK